VVGGGGAVIAAWGKNIWSQGGEENGGAALPVSGQGESEFPDINQD